MTVKILQGDCREVIKTLPAESVNCCVTSPPYWGLRDYGCEGQIGLESTPEEYVGKLVEVFREVRRVLQDDGTLWLNLGDSYASGGRDGHGKRVGYKQQTNRGMCGEADPRRAPQPDGLKPKDLVGIPWRVAFALQADGWYLRSDIIWAKPNPMPESVTDRPTKAHEYMFLLAKSERYYYDAEAIKEPAICGTDLGLLLGRNAGGDDANMVAWHAQSIADRQAGGVDSKTGNPSGTRNRRSVWTVATDPYSGAHFATFPPALILPCILAGCPPAGKRCGCDDIIATPTGNGEIRDPTMRTGRAGMNRPRRENEGFRPITQREQRHEAAEMKVSPHRQKMERECGESFAHYIRTDDSGARPLPENIRSAFMERGWITPAPPCTHPVGPAGIVLDPFGGSGTTGEVAEQNGRNSILIELSPEYVKLAEKRTAQMGLFAGV